MSICEGYESKGSSITLPRSDNGLPGRSVCSDIGDEKRCCLETIKLLLTSQLPSDRDGIRDMSDFFASCSSSTVSSTISSSPLLISNFPLFRVLVDFCDCLYCFITKLRTAFRLSRDLLSAGFETLTKSRESDWVPSMRFLVRLCIFTLLPRRDAKKGDLWSCISTCGANVESFLTCEKTPPQRRMHASW